jgi:hypothetical protein
LDLLDDFLEVRDLFLVFLDGGIVLLMQDTNLVLKFLGFAIGNRQVIADVEDVVERQPQLSELDDFGNAGVCQLLEQSEFITASLNFDSFEFAAAIFPTVLGRRIFFREDVTGFEMAVSNGFQCVEEALGLAVGKQ